MNIKKQSKAKERIIKKLLGVTYRLDNSANGFFDTNGEAAFLDAFTKSYKDKNPVIFDVGANVGDYSDIVVKKLQGSTYSLHLFEPQKSCFKDLVKMFNNNSSITLNNSGLSSSSKTSTIYKNTEKSGLTSLYKRNISFYNLEMNIEEDITLERADMYITSHAINHIHLLKIDVEGHELDVLSGFGEFLNADFIDFIQFEYGGANLDSRTNLLDFYKLLLSRGFKIAKVMKQGLELREYDPRHDNFVYANYVAISERLITEK